MTKISIIVPCYNQAQYLNEALQSVLDQTYQDWECIIVNDGSPDDTEVIAKRWLEKDSRFKYIYKENGGLSSARNVGLDNANGDFIQFLDSDDLLNKYKLEKQLACFTTEIDIVICDYFPFDNETNSFKRERYMNPFPSEIDFKNEIIIKWEKELSIPCHCILFKKELLSQKDFKIRFDESLHNHEDWVFWVMVFYYSLGVFNFKYSLVDYRIHSTSMCYNFEEMQKGYILSIKSIQSFLIQINDKVRYRILYERLVENESSSKFNFKKTIKLFIPPIIILLKRKIFNSRNVSK